MPSPVEHLVNEPLQGEAAFGLWHDMTQPIFDLGHLGSRQNYRIESEWFVVDRLTFTKVQFAASTYRRTNRHLRRGDPDYFHLHMPISGVERGQVNCHPVMAGPGCSRATVHRLFEEVGGVRTFVRNKRLAECFNQLTLQPRAKRFVYEIAEEWGFTSSAHFSRAFRNRYGLSAQQLQDSAVHRSAAESCLAGDHWEIEQVRRWLTR